MNETSLQQAGCARSPTQLSNTCFRMRPNMMVFAIKSEKCRSNSERPRLGKMGAPNLSQKHRNSLKKERMSHISRNLRAVLCFQ
jgi:hypothetical protein